MEPSDTGARQAQSLGLNVRQGTLQDARYVDSFFDVIRLSNAVEHLPNPDLAFIDKHAGHGDLAKICEPRTTKQDSEIMGFGLCSASSAPSA